MRVPALLLTLATTSVFAQSTAGRFSGTIADPSGAAIPAVSVTAVNAETGQKIAERTNSQGQFVLYPLAPGVYDLTAQNTGFTTFTISGVKINVSENVLRNISLDVGAMTQSGRMAGHAASLEGG